MPYRELYDYCQSIAVPVGRNAIREKLRELMPDAPLTVFCDSLNREKVQGYYVSARNTESRFVQQAGGAAVIVYARGLNTCWERFVVVKEMMHLFDDPLQSTGTPTDLEALLVDFWGNSESGEMCPQMISELNCFWMAIGLLCPEITRADMQTARSAGTLSDNQIAHQLRVPEKYVPSFFHARYKSIIGGLLD